MLQNPRKKARKLLSLFLSKVFGLLFHLFLWGGNQSVTNLHAPPECIGRGKEEQRQQSAAKQQARHEPAGICAFVGSQRLNTAVQYHGNHQKGRPERTYTNPWIAQRCSQNPHKFPRAAGTNRKTPPMIMERSIIPAVAAAKSGQPDIQPGDHCIMAKPTPAATTTT